MTRMTRALSIVAVMMVAAAIGQAQTCTTPFATLLSPPDGSTLQPDPITGLTNISWCNASADYFVILETVPGGHDLFYAFTGGAGGGAGQNFLDLSQNCLPAAPFGCIPPSGAHVYFTLFTVKNKQIIGSASYNFTEPAPAGQAATTTTVGAASVTASSADQNVTLTANVTAATTVNQGTVTFQLMLGATPIGLPLTSAPITNGSVSVGYLLPAASGLGAYTIQAAYSGGANFLASTGTGTLNVTAPSPIPVATLLTTDPQNATFSSITQNVTLTARVCLSTPGCTGSAVNEGNVTLQVMDGTTAIGTAVTSRTVLNGSATVVYGLPAGLVAGPYTVQATYSGGSSFAASTGSGTLTVNNAPPPTQHATVVTVSNNAAVFSATAQNVTAAAAVSALDSLGLPVPVNEGVITFQVMDGTTVIGTAIPSSTVVNGSASVNYWLPPGLPAKAIGYVLQASYSGGPNFGASNGVGTLLINKAQSTTNFTSVSPDTMPFHGTYTPTVTSTGDGSLTIDASGACSIAIGVVTMTAGAGNCTVTASMAEGNNFLGSSATQIITATKAVSTTAFTTSAPLVLAVKDTYSPRATSTGDGTLTLGASGACTISNSIVTATAVGTCTVTATESDGNNFVGSSAAQNVTVVKRTPTIPELIAEVQKLNLAKDYKRILLDYLQGAQGLLSRHPEDAIRTLHGFIEQVRELQSRKKLDSTSAQRLMTEAQAIIQAITPKKPPKTSKR